MTPNKSEGNEDAKDKEVRTRNMATHEDDEIDIEDVLTTASKGGGGRTTMTNIKIRTRKKSRRKSDQDGHGSSCVDGNYELASTSLESRNQTSSSLSNDKGLYRYTDLESGNGQPSSIMSNDYGLSSTAAFDSGNEQPTTIQSGQNPLFGVGSDKCKSEFKNRVEI